MQACLLLLSASPSCGVLVSLLVPFPYRCLLLPRYRVYNVGTRSYAADKLQPVVEVPVRPDTAPPLSHLVHFLKDAQQFLGAPPRPHSLSHSPRCTQPRLCLRL